MNRVLLLVVFPLLANQCLEGAEPSAKLARPRTTRNRGGASGGSSTAFAFVIHLRLCDSLYRWLLLVAPAHRG